MRKRLLNIADCVMTLLLVSAIAVVCGTRGDEQGLRVSGYVVTYRMNSNYIRISRNAVEEGMKQLSTTKTMLLFHDPTRPVGVVDSCRVDSCGLWITGRILDRRVASMVRSGLLRWYSVGVKPTTDSIDLDGDMLVRVITRCNIFEVSLVATPADTACRIVCGR